MKPILETLNDIYSNETSKKMVTSTSNTINNLVRHSSYASKDNKRIDITDEGNLDLIKDVIDEYSFNLSTYGIANLRNIKSSDNQDLICEICMNSEGKGNKCKNLFAVENEKTHDRLFAGRECIKKFGIKVKADGHVIIDEEADNEIDNVIKLYESYKNSNVNYIMTFCAENNRRLLNNLSKLRKGYDSLYKKYIELEEEYYNSAITIYNFHDDPDFKTTKMYTKIQNQFDSCRDFCREFCNKGQYMFIPFENLFKREICKGISLVLMLASYFESYNTLNRVKGENPLKNIDFSKALDFKDNIYVSDGLGSYNAEFKAFYDLNKAPKTEKCKTKTVRRNVPLSLMLAYVIAIPDDEGMITGLMDKLKLDALTKLFNTLSIVVEKDVFNKAGVIFRDDEDKNFLCDKFNLVYDIAVALIEKKTNDIKPRKSKTKKIDVNKYS